MTDRSIPPVIHDVPLPSIPDVSTIYLPNGIRLVMLDSGDTADVTRMTFSWKGGRYDSPKAPASEIASKLITAGSLDMSPHAFADLLDYNGAWLSNELSGHNNAITLFSLNRSLDTLSGVLVDIINRPLFPSREFNTIKEKTASQRATQLKRVTTHAEETDRELSFGDTHPAALRWSPEDIRAIVLDEVITESRRLSGRQAPTVFMAGRITDDILKTATRRLSQLDCDPLEQGHAFIIPATPSPSTHRHTQLPHSLQSAIRITIPTVSRHSPYYEAIRLMTTALGGYFGSRLMTSIREEKGLTYGISAAVYGYHEGAFITITSQCDNRYADRVIEEVEREIEKLSTIPMDSEELHAVKQTATGTMLTMSDTPFNIMDYYIVKHHLNTPDDYFKRQQHAIATLSPELIRDTAARFLADKPRLVSTAGS